MASPQAIRKNAEAADEMIRRMAAGEQQAPEAELDTSEGTDPAVPAEGTPPEADPGVPAPEGGQQQQLDFGDDDPLAKARDEAAKWEQRWRSLDGMIKARDRQIEQLQDMLASLAQAGPAKPTEPEPAPSALISEKDVDAFGADLIDLARRAAREEQADLINAMENRIKQLEGNLTQTQQSVQETQQERFQQELGRLAPNWQKTDTDPAFIDWLKSSSARARVFGTAAQSLDAVTLAEFYNEWDGKQAKPATQAQAAVEANRAKLERQLAPGKTKAAPAPVVDDPNEKKQWTRTEIAQAYANRKAMKPEEFAKLEKDIMAAQREGRVDYSK